jgi:hypothetical protein
MNNLFYHFKNILQQNNIILTFNEKTIAFKQLNRFINRIQYKGELNNNNILNNCKSNLKEFTIKGDKISVCVRKIKEDEHTEFYFLNFHNVAVNCVILQIDTNTNICHLTDLVKQRGCLLKKIGDKFEDDFDKIGDFIINIIIKICNHLNIQQIQLLDDSYINCKNNKDYFRINLIKSRMMIDGDTWYGKFGFYPLDEEDKTKYENNKKKYLGVLTKNIFIKNILYKTPEIAKYNKSFNEIIDKHKSLLIDPLCIFLYWLLNTHCEIYHYIYDKIYQMARYEIYKNDTWVLNL